MSTYTKVFLLRLNIQRFNWVNFNPDPEVEITDLLSLPYNVTYSDLFDALTFFFRFDRYGA